MVTITKVIVKSFSLAYLDVFWEIADVGSTVDLNDYRFTVTRSEAPEGPFERCSPPLTDLYTYRDRRVDLEAKWRTVYYQIRVTKPSDPGFLCLSPISYVGDPPDLVSLEIMREVELNLKINIGRPVVILQRKTFGPHCPDCFNTIRMRKQDSKCETCFSSKYRGGFLNPIAIFANMQPNSKTIRHANFQDMTPSESVVEIGGYPLVRTSDVVVEDTNRRWMVEDVRERSHRRFVHRQICRVKELPKQDVIYKFAIDESMFKITEEIEVYGPERPTIIPRTGDILRHDSISDFEFELPWKKREEL
jgi:hypothetical protein